MLTETEKEELKKHYNECKLILELASGKIVKLHLGTIALSEKEFIEHAEQFAEITQKGE